MKLQSLFLPLMLVLNLPGVRLMAQKAPAKKSAKVAGPKKLEMTLADVGITPRALGTWKRTGVRNDMSFWVITFEPQARGWIEDGVELPTFEVFGTNPFNDIGRPRNLGFLRLTSKGPILSDQEGGHYTLAETDGEKKMWAFNNLFVALYPMDETFTPVRFQATALERGIITRTVKGVKPFFHSLVAAFAFGKNECKGILKYPGTNFVVPFRGVKFGDKWVARSIEEQAFQVTVWDGRTSGSPALVGALALQSGRFTQMEFDSKRLMLGCGPSFVNYAVPGEASESLEAANEWDLQKGVDLAFLGEAFAKNFGRSMWMNSDEDASFSREAESAFFAAGLKAYYFAPLNSWGGYSGYSQGAADSLNPILRRIGQMNGRYGLLNWQGIPN